MPQVEFHILTAAGDDARTRYACKWVEDTYAQSQRVFIYAGSETAARRIDDTLWTFRDQAFIPHELASSQSPSHERIAALIGIDTTTPTGFADTLLNLSLELPSGFESFARIIEVVDADPHSKQAGRERYRQYRERGCALETKNI